MSLEISVSSEIDEWFIGGEPWVIIDRMIGDSLYSTAYLCRACCAELTELRVHHVRWCPYCGAELPFLLDGAERAHIKFYGEWPYDLLRLRFPSWCSWLGSGDEPILITENGTSQVLTFCRLLEGHEGDHVFVTGRERPPVNPIRSAS